MSTATEQTREQWLAERSPNQRELQEVFLSHAETITAQRFDAGTNDEYHAGRGVSRSRLEEFREDRWLYFLRHIDGSLPPKKMTDDMHLGQAWHDLAADGELTNYAVIPRDVLNKDGHRKGKAWTEWRDANADKHHLKPEEAEHVFRVMESAREHPSAGWLLGLDAEPEMPIRGEHEPTSCLLRCRLDRFVDMGDHCILVDAKKTRSAAPDAFEKAIYDLGYHRQAAFYSQLAVALTGKPAIFYFIAGEMAPPYRVEVYDLDPDYVLEAHNEIFRGRDDSLGWGLIEQLNHCHETGNWRPPHYGKVLTAGKPRFAKYREEYAL